MQNITVYYDQFDASTSPFDNCEEVECVPTEVPFIYENGLSDSEDNGFSQANLDLFVQYGYDLDRMICVEVNGTYQWLYALEPLKC